MGCFKGCLCLYAFWGQSPFGKESAGGVEERQSLSTGRLISEGRQDSYTMRHAEVVAAIFGVIGGATEPEARTGMGDCARAMGMICHELSRSRIIPTSKLPRPSRLRTRKLSPRTNVSC